MPHFIYGKESRKSLCNAMAAHSSSGGAAEKGRIDAFRMGVRWLPSPPTRSLQAEGTLQPAVPSNRHFLIHAGICWALSCNIRNDQ